MDGAFTVAATAPAADAASVGAYASGSEVIRAGLRALKERDSAVERWLRDEVVPVTAAMQADPARAIPADRVFDEIRELHARRLKAAAGGA